MNRMKHKKLENKHQNQIKECKKITIKQKQEETMKKEKKNKKLCFFLKNSNTMCKTLEIMDPKERQKGQTNNIKSENVNMNADRADKQKA